MHYSYTATLGLRTFFVVTKADACDKEDLYRTVSELKEMIIDNKGVSFEVEREQHVTKAAESFAQNRYVDEMICKSVSLSMSTCQFSLFAIRAVPILTVSSVTGYNLNLVKKFLNTLPPLLSQKEVDKREQEPHEFQVHTYTHIGPSVGSAHT